MKSFAPVGLLTGLMWLALWPGAGLAIAEPSTPGIVPRTPPFPTKLINVPPPVMVRLPNVDYSRQLELSEELAIELALQKNPQLQVARCLVQEAQGERIAKSAALGPQVSLDSAYTLAGRIGGAEVSNAGSYSLMLEQLLWDGGQTSNQVNSLRQKEYKARLEQANTVAELIRDVRKAYYWLVAKKRFSDVARANLENRRNHLNMSHAKWESGLGLPSDVIRAEGLVSTATLSLNSARAESLSAGVKLSRLMGIDAQTPLAPSAPMQLPQDLSGEDLRPLILKAYDNRPDVRAARAEIEAAEYSLKQIQGLNSPVLTLNAGAVGKGEVYPPDSCGWQGGLRLSWSLYDSGEKQGRILQAESLLARKRAELSILQEDVARDIAVCSVRLRTALGSLEAADNAETCAREAVRIAEGRYNAGIGSFIEVVDAQDSLLSSSNNLVTALYEVWEARVEFDYIIGSNELWTTTEATLIPKFD